MNHYVIKRHTREVVGSETKHEVALLSAPLTWLEMLDELQKYSVDEDFPRVQYQVSVVSMKDKQRDPMDIHSWFGLTYSNYLVLPRTLLQSMPARWQYEFVVLLQELDEAFAHVETASSYSVQATREKEVSELTPAERQLVGVTRTESDEDADEGDAQYHYECNWVDPDFRVLVPIGDPVLPYNRGRTRIAPRNEDAVSDSVSPE